MERSKVWENEGCKCGGSTTIDSETTDNNFGRGTFKRENTNNGFDKDVFWTLTLDIDTLSIP